MLSPSVWFRRLWPLLVVLNSTACSEFGCTDRGRQSQDAVEFSISPGPLEFCWDQGNTEPVLAGTLIASLGTETGSRLYVRPNAHVPVRIEVEGYGEIPPGGEFAVDAQTSPRITVYALEDFDQGLIEFDVFLYAKDDPFHPDREVGKLYRSVTIRRAGCAPPPPAQRTAACPGTEEVRKVALAAADAVGVAGDTCWRILDAATFAMLSAKGGELGQPDSYAVDIVAAGGIEAAIAIGPTSARLNQWIPPALAGQGGEFGPTGYIVLFDNITDFLPYAGPGSPGGVLTNFTRGSLHFLVFDDQIGSFLLRSDHIASAAFPGAGGKAISALATGPAEDTFVVTDGVPGSLWVHRAVDRPAGAATKIGDVGNGPRRLRRFGNLLVASNFDSDSLTVARLDTREIVGHVPVGDGPVGIDGKILANGNVAIVSTGLNDNTYTITVLTTAGDVVSSESNAVPEGCLGPGHAIWHEDGILLSCHDSSEIVFLPATGPS